MRELKGCLWIAGILCGISSIGLFLPIATWQTFAQFLEADESSQPPPSPMMEYVVRVGSAMSALMGAYLIMLALQPMKYPALIPFTAVAAVTLGIVCGITGLLASIPLL